MSTPVPPPLLVPDGFPIPKSYLELPPYQHPWWVNPPLPRSTQQTPQGQNKTGVAQDDERGEAPASKAKPAEAPALPAFQEVRQFTIPVIEKEVPLPAPEILVTAVSTATVASAASVGATLAAKSLFAQVMKLAKPLSKTILKKLAALRKKPPPPSWARVRLSERRLDRVRKSVNRDGA